LTAIAVTIAAMGWLAELPTGIGQILLTAHLVIVTAETDAVAIVVANSFIDREDLLAGP
tara:strand:- start:180 stop:356 length:177 start_codon:yes stop_codon:yes gene_type:complete